MAKSVVTNQGPVVQSIISLTSSLVVKMLTVLVNTISNSQIVLLKKNVSSFCILFSKNISIYAIFNDQNFNDTLTNDIVSFEQLGPDVDFFQSLIWIYTVCSSLSVPIFGINMKINVLNGLNMAFHSSRYM